MSNANIYNIIALAGILLAIVFGVWLNRQTIKVKQEIERLTHKNTRLKRLLRGSRLR
jgi:hypothetical protein